MKIFFQTKQPASHQRFFFVYHASPIDTITLLQRVGIARHKSHVFSLSLPHPFTIVGGIIFFFFHPKREKNLVTFDRLHGALDKSVGQLYLTV